MTERPLFIPLKSQYFDDFLRGLKTSEMRLYGRRWNERTCRVGRAVVLSSGYGKAKRLNGRVSSFRKVHSTELPAEHRMAIFHCFNRTNVDIAEIGIEVSHD